MVQVTILPQSTKGRTAEYLGQSFAEGMAKNFVPPEQQVQRNLLQEAMKAMESEPNYEGKLKAILPTLSTTPGGHEILTTLMPILQKQQQMQATQEYLKSTQGQQAGQGQTQGQGGRVQSTPVKPGTQPIGQESTFPEPTAGPEPVPLMTPQERNQRMIDLQQQFMAQGSVPQPGQLEQIVDSENARRQQYNETIQKEKDIRIAAWDKMAGEATARAGNAGMLKSPEDETIFKKFVDENKRLNNPNEVYEAARNKFREFETARTSILNSTTLPGPFTKIWKGLQGNYKTIEDTIKPLKEPVQKMVKMGLVNEARNALSIGVGLGPEQVESLIDPPTQEVKQALAAIPKRQLDQITPPGKMSYQVDRREQFERKFPGQEAVLPAEKYMPFKEKLAKIVTDNPNLNLVDLRGRLNQDKLYAWQDINRAVIELIDEGRFTPNPLQQQQLAVIKEPPMPTLTEMFKHIWSGEK